MSCRRCGTGHLVTEELAVCVWRCVNCGDRTEDTPRGKADDRYQHAVSEMVDLLGRRTADCPAIEQAEAIGLAALGVK